MSDEHIKAVNLARKAIVDDLNARYKAGDTTVKGNRGSSSPYGEGQASAYISGAGEIACPVCKTGRLRYSRAAYNGHVHARCSGDNCVCWME